MVNLPLSQNLLFNPNFQHDISSISPDRQQQDLVRGQEKGLANLVSLGINPLPPLQGITSERFTFWERATLFPNCKCEIEDGKKQRWNHKPMAHKVESEIPWRSTHRSKHCPLIVFSVCVTQKSSIIVSGTTTSLNRKDYFTCDNWPH